MSLGSRVRVGGWICAISKREQTFQALVDTRAWIILQVWFPPCSTTPRKCKP
jgi:hypothetical protein